MAMQDNLKSKVVRGSMWVALEQLCVQGLNFGLGVVLARLLTPNEYGTVALVTIFIAIAQVIVGSGLGQALVQKREIDSLDINSVFCVSFVISLLAYPILFAIAPFVAAYYKMPVLTTILRVLALNLFFYSLNSVQNAELYKQMKFNLTFRISLAITIASAIVGVSMAYTGFGVWSLVWSSVSGSIVGTLVRFHYTSWRPSLKFSMERVRPLFAYGGKLMANSLLGSIFGNLYGIMIGKFYRPDDLAFVNKGRNIPSLALANINSSLIEVSLPALVQLQEDKDRLVEAMRRLLIVSTFVIFPLMMLFAVIASSVIPFLYGERWMPAVPYMQLAALWMIWEPIGAVNQHGMLAVGRSDLILKLSIVRNITSLLVLVVCLTQSVMVWMCVCTFLFGPFSALIDAFCGSRYLGYTISRQLRDLLPTALICIVSAVPLIALGLIISHGSSLELLLCMIAQGAMGIVLFIALSLVFRVRAAVEVAAIIVLKLQKDSRLKRFLMRFEQKV